MCQPFFPTDCAGISPRISAQILFPKMPRTHIAERGCWLTAPVFVALVIIFMLRFLVFCVLWSKRVFPFKGLRRDSSQNLGAKTSPKTVASHVAESVVGLTVPMFLLHLFYLFLCFLDL